MIVLYIDTEKNITAAMYGRVSQPKGHWHKGRRLSRHLLIALTRGELNMRIGDNIYHAEGGDVLLIPKGTLYAPLESDGLEYYFFHFTCAESEPRRENLKIDSVPSLPEGEYAYTYVSETSPVIAVQALTKAGGNIRVSEILDRVGKLNIWQNRAEKLLLDGYVRELLIVLSTDYSSPGDIATGFRRVLRYINAEYTAPITLSSLSERFGLSESYIARQFKEKLHTKSSDYINRVRISVACNLMLNSSFSIGEIAEKVGYNNQYYFSRVFRKMYGMTPNDFRRRSFSLMP